MERHNATLKLQDTLSEHNAPTKLNLYPVKRDLEKQIAATTEELAKAEREADGLAKMMNTCQSHPKYGKADSFREELKVANHRYSSHFNSVISSFLELAGAPHYIIT